MLRGLTQLFALQAADESTDFSFGKAASASSEPTDPAISALVDEGLEGMPAVNETVVAQLGDQEESESGEKDTEGVEYSATLHATGSDGRGIKTQGGKWRKKRGAKGVNSTLAGGRVAQPAVTKSAETDEEKRAKAAVVGVAGANAIFMLGQAIGGEEWAPLSINKAGEVKLEEYDERAMVERAITDYCVATGKTDFPPSLGLTVALTAYAMPRFRMPKTQSKMQRAKEWMVSKYVSFRMRKKGEGDGTQPAVRNDGERKNQPRQATS